MATTVYIVYRETGNYDEYDCVNIRAFAVEDNAKQFVDKANEQIGIWNKYAQKLKMIPDWQAPQIPISSDGKPWYKNDKLREDYRKKFKIHRDKWNTEKSKYLTLDTSIHPDLDPDYNTRYGYMALELE